MGLISIGLKIGIPIVLAAGILFFYAQGLKDVSLERFDIEGITNINSNSFTILGNFYIKNPSQISVPIQSVTYDVILKENNEKLSSGTIAGVLLEKEKTTTLPFQQEVQWIPTTQLALQLATQNHVYATIKGTIYIQPQEKIYELPFEQEVDIKAYIMQFAQEQVPVTIPETPETPSLF